MKKYKKLLLPDEYVDSVYDIDYSLYKESGIDNILFDLDGTITSFDSMDIDNRYVELVNQLKEDGFNIALYSDGSKGRIVPVVKILNIPFIYRAKKPFGSFKLVQNILGENCFPCNTMLIGNTYFFDILFANRVGMHSILVDTLSDQNFNLKESICHRLDNVMTYPIRKHKVKKRVK